MLWDACLDYVMLESKYLFFPMPSCLRTTRSNYTDANASSISLTRNKTWNMNKIRDS